MDGSYKEAMSYIEDSENLTSSNEDSTSKLEVQTLADNLVLAEKMTPTTVAAMNKASILLCAGDLRGAKEQLDVLLQKEDLNLITDSQSGEGMIPAYLIQQLVYFLLKTKNFKLARHLTKYRRFVIDAEHIDPVKAQDSQEYANKERTYNKTYVSTMKNFT